VARFVVIIETPATKQPATRAEDVNERAAIQAALLLVVNTVSNNGTYRGEITGGAAAARFDYEIDDAA
jgi:hypothetical protein